MFSKYAINVATARSARPAALFRDMGISAINIRGGINAWSRKELPIKKGQ